MEDLSNIVSGSYIVTITDNGTYNLTITDDNFCKKYESFTINTPAQLSSQIFSTNVSCRGLSDGTVNLTPVGGTAPYSFLWNNTQTTEDLSGLAIGTYSVEIEDANNCQSVDTAIVTQPLANLNIATSQTNLVCNSVPTGTIQLTVTGGTQPYSYSWDNGYTSSDLSNLFAGTYEVTVTDVNNCQAIASVTLTEANAIVANPVINNSTCGNSDASVNVSVLGGTGAGTYSYLWSNGASSNVLLNIKAGAYTLTITDASSCSEIVNVNVNDINAPTISSQTKSDLTCNGSADGSASVSISGGTSPYSYLWSNGTSTNSISGVSGGTYTLKVVDNAGCVLTNTVEIVEPDALTSVIIKKNVSCNAGSDGAINLIVEGGVEPYTFLWNNLTTNQNLSNILAGSYSVTIIDANSCQQINTNIAITQPNALTISTFTITPVQCFSEENGIIDLTISGGTPISGSYGYQWSNGEQTQDINGLIAGNYDVTVSDANSCETYKSFTVSEPNLLTLNISGVDVLCKGGNTGEASVVAVGGNAGAKTYSWNYGQTSSTISSLTAGNYVVTVSDTEGCFETSSIDILEPEDALTASISKTDIKCFGQTNGTANLEVRGGTPAYSYIWTNSTATTQD